MDRPGRATPDRDTDLAEVFPGDGEVARDLRRLDWSGTPLGRPHTWPQALASAVRIMLTSRFSMWMAWGPELTFLCNDAYRRDTLGVKYPWALGRSAREVWAEIWDDIGPRIDSVLRNGIATWDEALMLFLERSGYREETYHTFSYSPLVDDAGRTAGMLCVVVEETERVLGERRLATLRDLSASLAVAGMQQDVHRTLAAVFKRHDRDLPFVAVYQAAPGTAPQRVTPGATAIDEALARLVEAVGADPDGTVARLAADATASAPPGGWDAPTDAVIVLPLSAKPTAPTTTASEGAAWLLAGVNPYRPAAETASFAGLVARQFSASLGTVRAVEAERRRAAELEELDRAKTHFFSNVSHEFRTPLTLMLGPLDELRRIHAQREDARTVHELEVIHRNGVRLSKLVNSLLEFSRLQAGRADARFEPLDLPALTEELVGSFRTVVELAGLELRVACEPLAEPVYADPNMWERIVLNLMSNAVKYTFAGGIEVRLRRVGDAVALSVTDTGIGIGPDDLPRVFERFHRVANARARSAEGSGIGLALVGELVGLHGGTIDAVSTPGEGSTFTVTLPLGRAHLPPERLTDTPSDVPFMAVDAFVAESLGWIEDDRSLVARHERAGGGAGAGDADVLVVDDNADMRSYVQRVLGASFRTRTARDGAEALEAIRSARPDLVVSDVMMPNVDGFELVRRLRADPQLADIPIMLLTAQAGSSGEVRGINVGADDYLVKPFSSDELVARVHARLLASAERRRRHRLGELAEALQRASGPDDVVRAAHDLFAGSTGAAHTTLAVLDDDGAHVRAVHHPPFRGGINERYYRIGVDAPIPLCAAVRDRRAVAVVDLDDAARQFPDVVDDYRGSGTAATLAVPLVRPSGIVAGSLTASWSSPRTPAHDEVTWFTQVAAAVGDALDRIRDSTRDQQVLRAFQEQMLAVDHRSPIAVVAARYQPAANDLLVGGDWYDLSTRPDGALRVSIGDVVGKGLTAARVMAQLRSAVGTAAGWIDEPSDVVRVVDTYAEQVPGALCATLTYLVLHPDRTLTWCAAGHPPPLVASGESVTLLPGGRRPPLAARPGSTAAPATATLQPGALLLLYTDGLVERRGEDASAGDERLVASVRALRHLPLDELCDALLEALRPDGGYRDDVALLAVRTCGTSTDRFVHAHRATAEDVRRGRAALRAWLADRDLPERVGIEVLLAVGEAVANACEHGAAFDPRAVVGIEVAHHDGVVRAAVSDHGRWTTDSSASAQRGRGRGFAIMNRTMDRVEVRRTPVGTTVLLERVLSGTGASGAR